MNFVHRVVFKIICYLLLAQVTRPGPTHPTSPPTALSVRFGQAKLDLNNSER